MRVLNPGSAGCASRSDAIVDDPVLRAIDVIENADLDQISAVTGRAPAELLARLLELELQGLVRRVPGGRFVRSQGTC